MRTEHILIAALLACTSSPPDDSPTAPCSPGEFRLDRSEGSTLTGCYGLGDESFAFAAEQPEDGAEVVASYSGAGATLRVRLLSATDVHLEWQGQQYDGLGALAEERVQALEALAASELGKVLSYVPLELGCAVSSGAALRAALLVPWQLLIKYVAAFPADAEYWGPSATCPNVPEGPGDPAREGLLFGHAESFPRVYGYFPFDAQGAAARADAFRNPGPCSSRCSGACGVGCSTNSCEASRSDSRCVVDAVGQNTGQSEPTRVYVCGVTPACVAQDACYERCSADYECTSWERFACMHGPAGCDATCATEHGAPQCALWAEGKASDSGVFDEVQEFAERSGPTRDDRMACP